MDGIAKICDKEGNQKWQEMLELIPNNNWKITGGPKEIPFVFEFSESKNCLLAILLASSFSYSRRNSCFTFERPSLSKTRHVETSFELNQSKKKFRNSR